MKNQKPNYSYKKPELTNGDLVTPVRFYSSRVKPGLDGRDTINEAVYFSFAKVSPPSMKDIELATNVKMTARTTIRIRDPLDAYQPSTKDLVVIEDSREKGRFWKIVAIRPDYDDRNVLVVVIGGPQNER
ncbi:phage head-tail adapter protein [Streptococcus sp. 121]|uniref:phage head-tail adapter protein n=1 Tax=Streptococcus sp. 121 TaxID=2797637 RepID=UPI0018F1025A|nr:phage head-tail adapter protein [Streptococcus sp. 121]MBJ6745207.1 phage head-tail adapter protein [Streptococcus sp. 121]